MSEDRRVAWIDQAWRVLHAIPTGTSVDQLEARWNKHRQRQRPVAAIFGAYDAGKSSLLKRLLFEDGAAIPEWLTVSGRRETFSVDEADGASWIFRDSPGIAGGNAVHDQAAIESLELADLVIWALPPQLVTSEKELFAAIFTGSRFGVSGAEVSAALVAVILRIDEAGIDAAANPAGFLQLCTGKQAEFTALLASIGLASPQWGIFPISADPYQGVGNGPPDAGTYAMGKGWDGVPPLQAALKQAAGQAGELRILAGLRYLSSIITELTRSILKERAEREEALRTSRDEAERFALWRANLEALHGKWKAALQRVVEDELLSASRTGTAAASETLHGRLITSIDRWGEQAYAEFEHLAASAQQELGQRFASPSMERLKQLVLEMGEAEGSDAKSGIDAKLMKHVGRIGNTFREAFNAYVNVDLGVSFEDATKHIWEARKSGKSIEKFFETSNPFGSLKNARQASNYVKWGQAMDAVVPVVTQLGGIIYEVAGEIISQQEADKKQEQRHKLRDTLRQRTIEVEDEAMTAVENMYGAFSQWIDEREKAYMAIGASIEAQLVALGEYAATLDGLMQERLA
jgi:hypothetical protein